MNDDESESTLHSAVYVGGGAEDFCGASFFRTETNDPGSEPMQFDYD